MRRHQRKVALHVSRLEEECTEEDITEAIKGALGRPVTDVAVVNIRPLRYDSKKATVIMWEDDAKELELIQSVRIGIISTSFKIRAPLAEVPTLLGGAPG